MQIEMTNFFILNTLYTIFDAMISAFLMHRVAKMILMLKFDFNQRFIQQKIGPEIGPFTKIGDLKTGPSQKLSTLKRALHKNRRP